MAVKVTPLCKEELRPFVGKSFKSLDAAISFYEDYAKEVGFDPRKSGRKTTGGIGLGLLRTMLRMICTSVNASCIREVAEETSFNICAWFFYLNFSGSDRFLLR
ncbi:uncharacterized protein LOC125206093 [Salvia hispanica]|uniref:uncharacterized protein LOC125192021 n=1 Tax=Salvia hispanica TaxID=49212 RepID=UPI0020092897|nr:uncharacterized protein LOC125192021 [Salvia hispanica]XP_047961374.1 uncharacterized protein LOC125206093 [Salvia hispanica]